MADITRQKPVAWRKRLVSKPVYSVSGYTRSPLRRLTVFAWFLIALSVLATLAVTVIIVNSVAQSRNTSVPLPERLAELQKSNATSPAATAPAQLLPSPPPAKQPETSKVVIPPTVAAVAQPTPTSAPAPTPTVNPNDAPWARQLIQQPDGTLSAPEAVDKATADLGAYYLHLQNLSLDQFMRERFDLLNTYFTGQALAQMRQQENGRTQYAMKTSGTVIIEIRNFSADGNTAIAGITRQGWVVDVYDVTSRKLLQQGVSLPDSLSVMSITFDHASGLWKFATLDPDSGVQQ